MERVIPWCVAALLGGAIAIYGVTTDGPTSIRAAAAAPEFKSASEQHGAMDHDDAGHHHHQHNADHRGAGHSAAGLADHHHHHHAHPHSADPHHHHPH